MKKCPFCAEEIQDDAIKCRFCNAIVVQPPKPEPWYCNPGSIFIGFCVVGPFVLPLVWVNPRYSNVTKIVLTVIIAVLSWVLGMLIAPLGKSIFDYYKLLFDLLNGKY